MPTCGARTKQGKPCSAYAIRGSRYCFAHEPTRAHERLQARRLGGMRRGAHAGELAGVPTTVRSIGDVMAVLDYTLSELSALDNGIPRARALIALASEYLHALETTELEERLTALEEQAQNVKAR